MTGTTTVCWTLLKPGLYPHSFGSKIQNPLDSSARILFVWFYVWVGVWQWTCVSLYIECVMHLQGPCGFVRVVSWARPLTWICGLTAEEFITDNYVRMCWKRNRPRTVWAGRCWASAYTVPPAPCSLPHTLQPPPGLSKLERTAEKTLESPNQILFYFSPYSPLTSLSPYKTTILCTQEKMFNSAICLLANELKSITENV